MENLQDKVGEVPVVALQESKPVEYQGLNFVEDAAYQGGTSIMYWM